MINFWVFITFKCVRLYVCVDFWNIKIKFCVCWMLLKFIRTKRRLINDIDCMTFIPTYSSSSNRIFETHSEVLYRKRSKSYRVREIHFPRIFFLLLKNMRSFPLSIKFTFPPFFHLFIYHFIFLLINIFFPFDKYTINY